MSAVFKIASMFGLIPRWRQRSAAESDLAELACLGSGELERMVQDAPLFALEARGTGGGAGGDDLLRRRMAALRLDADEMSRLEPAVVRHLQRLCALCESRDECGRDLAIASSEASSDSSDLGEQDWRDYCPNVGTLNMLVALDSYSHVRI